MASGCRRRCQARFAPRRRSCASTRTPRRGSRTTPATRRRRTSSATTSRTSPTTHSTNAAVLVIGVGGGRDVLSALEFGQRSVTGVEINPNILKITNGVYGDYTGHLDRDPRVTFVSGRGPELPHAVEEPLRPHPDVAHRHVGGVLGRRVRAERELAVHHPGWDTFLDRLTPNGIALGVALVLDSRTGAAARGLPRGRARRTRCSATAASSSRARTYWRTPAHRTRRGRRP